MTKFIFVLIFFTALSSSFAEDKNHFFINLKTKTEKQQIDILKTRLEFMGRTGMDLQVSKTSALYFRLTEGKEDRLKVFLNIAKEPRKVDNFGEIYKLMLKEFPFRERYRFIVENYKLFEGSLKDVVNDYILNNLFYETVDIAVANRAIVESVLTNFAIVNGKHVPKVLRIAVDFGFDDISQKLIDKYDKTIMADKKALIHKCRFLYQQNKLVEAQACYDTHPDDPWYGAGKLYIKSARNQPISQNEGSPIALLLESTKSARAFPYALFDKVFLQKKITVDDVNQFKVAGGFNRRSGGFLYLCYARSLGEATQALVQKDLEEYIKRNSDHAFVDVLRGLKDPSMVCDNLGAKSRHCEACKGEQVR